MSSENGNNVYPVYPEIPDFCRIAMNVVRDMIEMNKDNQDKYKGIPVECCLEVIGK